MLKLHDFCNRAGARILWCTPVFGQAVGTQHIDEILAVWYPTHKTFRSEEHTSELQSLMRISYAVFCLKKKKQKNRQQYTHSCLHNQHKKIRLSRDLLYFSPMQ